MIIPFTYNMMKRHPKLMAMIHRDAEGSSRLSPSCFIPSPSAPILTSYSSLSTEDGTDPSSDPFDPLEANPLLTGALSSSLWELHSHRTHYHSGVATLAKVLEEAFTRGEYGMEDFLDLGYGGVSSPILL